MLFPRENLAILAKGACGGTGNRLTIVRQDGCLDGKRNAVPAVGGGSHRRK
jgi:hypothetical protein